jgi:hypothetical protein
MAASAGRNSRRSDAGMAVLVVEVEHTRVDQRGVAASALILTRRVEPAISTAAGKRILRCSDAPPIYSRLHSCGRVEGCAGDDGSRPQRATGAGSGNSRRRTMTRGCGARSAAEPATEAEQCPQWNNFDCDGPFVHTGVGGVRRLREAGERSRRPRQSEATPSPAASRTCSFASLCAAMLALVADHSCTLRPPESIVRRSRRSSRFSRWVSGLFGEC